MGFFDKLFGGKNAAETKFKGEKKTVIRILAISKSTLEVPSSIMKSPQLKATH